MAEHKHIRHLKKHRNVLYGVVVVLLIMQIISFVAISSQMSKINSQQEVIRNDIDNYVEELQLDISSVKQENQFGINALTQEVAQQKKDIQSEINLLKSSQEDFSGVIEDVIKGVVSVGTDRSAGSGFLVRDDGYIVTNFHVIQGGAFIRISTFDKELYDATVVGMDPDNDLALLKVVGHFEKLNLANSDNVQIGEKVIAIGNPLGLSFTVTEGIVSAANRVGPNGLPFYIQTDVAVNPGNSGGPLINKKGKVIGINNFKIGGAESLGFALESNVIETWVNQVLNPPID